MYNTFNMGIGLVIAVNRDDVGAVHDALIQIGEHPYVIGCCTEGEKGVELKW
jgi:phosphoribosylformylglycinamidine cyclo-ligase